MSNYLDLAKKLKALAEKGIGGEKSNAQEILDRFLKKHNISLEEIEEDKQLEHFINLKTETESNLLNQIAKSVNYQIKVYRIPTGFKKQHKLSGNNMIECTYSEFIEIKSMLDFYLPIFHSENEIFFAAFCRANDLISKSPNPKSINELSKKDLEDYLRQVKMSENIKSEKHHKRLNSNGFF